MPAILITGNPVDGFGFMGPFESKDDAADWADDNDVEPDWWVATLFEPEEEEHE